MKIRAHPTYKRKWYIYAALYWVPFIVICMCFLIFDISKEHFLHDPVIGTMLLLGVIWFVGILFYPPTRCPECGQKTKYNKHLENKNTSRVCIPCETIWDLGVSPPD